MSRLINALAKRVAKGNSNPAKNLPAFLRKTTPTSIAVLHQENKSKIQHVKTLERLTASEAHQ